MLTKNRVVTKSLLVFGTVLCLTVSSSAWAQSSESSDSVKAAVDYLTQVVSSKFDDLKTFIRDQFVIGEPLSANKVAADKLKSALDENSLNSVDLDFSNECVAQLNLLSLGVDTKQLGTTGNSLYDEQKKKIAAKCSRFGSSASFDDFYKRIFPGELKGMSRLSGSDEVSSDLNPETLLGKLQYSSDDVKNVRDFIQYTESEGRGSAVNLQDELVRYENPRTSNPMLGTPYYLGYSPDSETTDVKYHIVYLNSPSIYQSVLDNVRMSEAYRSYMATYKADVAKRALFMNDVIRAYLRRVPNEAGKAGDFPPKGVSIAKYEHDEVFRRLSDDYYSKVVSATPAQVSKETLLTMNQILLQLYEINQRSERMIVKKSITEMPDISVSDDSKADILNATYCTLAKFGVIDWATKKKLDPSLCD